MTIKKWPPISIGTRVKTLKENSNITDWRIEARASRQWNVYGTVVRYHDSHGLSYEVRHQDGTIGHYDPSEIRLLHLF